MNVNQASTEFFIGLLLVSAWQLLWRGLALWRAARNQQKGWFIAITALFIINDLGLLPILYLFFFAKHKLTIHEMTKWFSKKK